MTGASLSISGGHQAGPSPPSTSHKPAKCGRQYLLLSCLHTAQSSWEEKAKQRDQGDGRHLVFLAASPSGP